MTTGTRILSGALMLRFVSIGFYLPLTAIPMYAESAGSRTGAGFANGALLLATVAGELATPRLLARVGYRCALALGLGLLGAPTLALLASASFPLIFAVNATRGVGFAITCVAGGALTAALIPDGRRGEGLAIVGLVGGVPSLLALPVGAWAAGHGDFAVVFVLAALAPLAVIATVLGLPHHDAASGGRHGVIAGLRNRTLARPAAIFAASASAAGVVVTYLPLAVAGRASWVAPVALLLQPAASTGGRWFAGRLGDRRGQTSLLVPGVALSIVGMTTMAATSSGLLVAVGAATFGTGFGVLQNATLSLMYARVPTAGYGTVSALWNAAYDAGMGTGAICIGILVSATGYSAAFLLTAVIMAPTLLVSRRESARTPKWPHSAEQAVSAELVAA